MCVRQDGLSLDRGVGELWSTLSGKRHPQDPLSASGTGATDSISDSQSVLLRGHEKVGFPWQREDITSPWSKVKTASFYII